MPFLKKLRLCWPRSAFTEAAGRRTRVLASRALASRILANCILAMAAAFMIAPGALCTSARCEETSPAPVQEPQLAGSYRVTGSGLGGAGKYAGKAEIRKTGETYQLTWTIGQSRYAGTGFVYGSMLCVVFVPAQGRPGAAVYEIGRGGTLSGRYTALGAASAASEILEPLDRF